MDSHYEIILGGWNNTRTELVRYQKKIKLEQANVFTPQILNGNQFTEFWIQWTYEGVTLFK